MKFKTGADIAGVKTPVLPLPSPGLKTKTNTEPKKSGTAPMSSPAKVSSAPKATNLYQWATDIEEFWNQFQDENAARNSGVQAIEPSFEYWDSKEKRISELAQNGAELFYGLENNKDLYSPDDYDALTLGIGEYARSLGELQRAIRKVKQYAHPFVDNDDAAQANANTDFERDAIAQDKRTGVKKDPAYAAREKARMDTVVAARGHVSAELRASTENKGIPQKKMDDIEKSARGYFTVENGTTVDDTAGLMVLYELLPYMNSEQRKKVAEILVDYGKLPNYYDATINKELQEYCNEIIESRRPGERVTGQTNTVNVGGVDVGVDNALYADEKTLAEKSAEDSGALRNNNLLPGEADKIARRMIQRDFYIGAPVKQQKEKQIEDVEYLEKTLKKHYTQDGGRLSDFFNQFGANYTLGDIGNTESLAWSDYLAVPSEHNRNFALALGKLSEEFQKNNRDTLVASQKDSFLNIKKSFVTHVAQNLPQQIYLGKAKIVGGLIGAALTWSKQGAQWGASVASAGAMHRLVQGSTFKELVEAGVDEETARALANDDAVIQGVIEGADTYVDWFLMGYNQVAGALGFGGKEVAKKAAESVMKKLLKGLGKYGLNIVQEHLEESAQEISSIAAGRISNVTKGDFWDRIGMPGMGDMFAQYFTVLGKVLSPQTDEDRAMRERVHEAGVGGGWLAAFTGGGAMVKNALLTSTINGMSDAHLGGQIKEEGDLSVLAAIAYGKTAESKSAQKLAAALEADFFAGREVSGEKLGRLVRSASDEAAAAQEAMKGNESDEEVHIAPTFSDEDLNAQYAEISGEQYRQEHGALPLPSPGAEKMDSATGSTAPATERTGALPLPSPGMKNAVSGAETTERTSIDDNPTTHTPREQQIIDAYKASADQTLLNWLRKILGIKDVEYKNKLYYNIQTQTDNAAQKARELTGVNTDGFRSIIKGNAVQHIENRHGPNGKADDSMSEIEDVARIGFVLDNFTNAEVITVGDVDEETAKLSKEWRNEDNSQAPMIRYSMPVDGIYYVVEAVPSSKAKRMAVVSAYMSSANKNSSTLNQVLNLPGNPTSSVTPETPLELLDATEDSITTSEEKSQEKKTKALPLPAPGLENAASGTETARQGALALKAYGTNDPARQARFRQAEQIAKTFGAELRVAALENGAQASYRNGVVTIDPNVKDPVQALLLHELTHHMERNEGYGKYASAIIEHLRETKGDKWLAKMEREIRADYAKENVKLDDAGVRKELIAKFSETLQDERFAKRLARENPNVAQKIIDWCADQIAKLRARFGGDKEAAFLVDMRRMYEKALRSAQSGEASETEQYSFGGENALTKNVTTLEEAERMERDGTDVEDIRKETGWFRGMDGKWRFEIDDSGMQYFRAGDALYRQMHPEYAEYQKLMDGALAGELTADEEARLRELDRTWGRDRARLSERVENGGVTLENLIRHDALFAAYPELREVKVEFADLGDGENGNYDRNSNTITIDSSLRSAPESTLVHEIQHAVQSIEGFTLGASSENANYRDVAGEIEARDAARRRNMTEEQRKTAAPDLGDGNTVFADENDEEVDAALGGRQFAEDKYFQRQIDKWDDLPDRSRVKVGVVRKNSALNRVGLPEGKLFFDVGKIRSAFDNHMDHLEKTVLKMIPELLNDPIVITEYSGASNTVSVYGNLFVHNTPVVVGVVMRLDSSGNSMVNKIRTIHARGDFANQITDKSVLYLNEDKKRTRSWFQGCGILNVPLDGTKYGLIRSIAYQSEKVKMKFADGSQESGQNATGRNFQELSDDVFEELTKSEPPEAEDPSVRDRLRQRDLDEYWEDMGRLAEAIASEENPDPEDLVQTDVGRERKPLREKIGDVRSFIARKFVDAGDAVSQIQKQTKDRYLYAYFNQARASANAAVQMIEGNRFDVLGRNTGDGLNKVLEDVRSKGAEYYRDFQLYLLHLHNVDRMQRESQSRIDEARAAFESFKQENPELSQFADYQIARMAAEETSPYYFEAGEYMRLIQAMQRAESTRNRPVFGHDVTAQDSRATADRLLHEHPEFKEEADKVYAYIDNLLRYRVDSGLISEQEYETLKAIYPHYVPTYRVFDKAGVDTRETGSVQIGKTVGRATGSDEKLMPLHIALARQTMNVVREGSKNRFGQRLMNNGSQRTKYVQSVEDYKSDFNENTFDELEDTAPKKKNTFVVREDGKLYQITVSPELFEAVQAMSPDRPENNFFLNGARKFNRAFKALTTGKKPTFLISNFSRDIQDAMLYSKDLSEFMKQYPQAWKEITTNGEYWQRYKALGGIYSSFFENGREADIGEGSAAKRTLKKINDKTLGRIETLNEMVEQAPRFAEFMATMKKNGGLDADMDTCMEALHNAAEITVNFGRAGTWSKFINEYLVPFWNPGIQGFDKMVRTATETKGLLPWGKLIAKAVIFGVVPRVLNGLLYKDDDEWEIMDERTKDAYYLFKLAPGKWIKIPKGRVLSVIGAGASRAWDAVNGKDVDLSDFIEFTASQTAPSDPLNNNIFAAWTKTKLLDPDDPGETWYGGDIESQRLRGYAPGERYDQRTDMISRRIGKALGISPKKLNYLFKQYTGVVGDVLLPVFTPANDKGALSGAVGMFENAFTLNPTVSNKLSGEFYDQMDKLEYAKNADGASGADSVVYKFWNRRSSAVSEINKTIREIEANTELSNKDKRELLQVQHGLRNAAIQQAQAYLPKYREAAAKYYEQADGMEEDDRQAYAYRMANRDVLGAEEALRIYSKPVYEKAQQLSGEGVSFDHSFDVYFAMRDAAKDLTGYQKTNAERNAIAAAKIPEKEKIALYQTFTDTKHGRDDDIARCSAAGLSFEQFLTAQNKYAEVNSEFGKEKASRKTIEFSRWINQQDFTEEQAAALRESFRFFSMNPTDDTQYDKLLAKGIDEEKAYDLSLQYEELKRILPKYDADGNGSYTHEEIRVALNAMDITPEERAELWALKTKKSKASFFELAAPEGSKRKKTDKTKDGLSLPAPRLKLTPPKLKTPKLSLPAPKLKK